MTPSNISRLFGLFTAAIFALWGNLPVAVQILLVVMSLDILSGVIRTISQKKLSSSIAWAGITKKAAALVIVALVHYLTLVSKIALPVGETVAGYYIYTEALSVIENASATGLPIPTWLKDALAQLAPHKEQAPYAFDVKDKSPNER